MFRKLSLLVFAAAFLATSDHAQDVLTGQFVRHMVRIEPVGSPGCGSLTTFDVTDPSTTIPVSFSCNGRSFSGEVDFSLPATPPTAFASADDMWFDLETPVTPSIRVEATTKAPGDTEKEPYALSLYAQITEGPNVVCSDILSKPHNAGTTASASIDVSCGVGRLAHSPGSVEGAFGSIAVFAVANNDGPTIQGAVTLTTIYSFEDAVPLTISPSAAPNTVVPGLFDEPLAVTIRGDGFAPGATVTLQDVFVQNVHVINETTIEAELAGFSGLAEGPRDLIVRNSDNEEIRGDDLFFVSSLVPVSPIVNQGIPIFCGSGGRICIANHDAFVRVALECNGSGCERNKKQTRGWLHVYRDGSPLPGSPFISSPDAVSARPTGSVIDAPLFRDLQDSFNFIFEGSDALAEGTYDFVFEIDPRNPETLPTQATQPNEKDHFVWRRDAQTFRSSSTARRIRAAVLFDVTAIRQRRRLLPQATAYFDFIRAAYPASADLLTFDLIPDSWISWTSYDETMKALADWLSAQRKLLVEPYTHVVLSTLEPVSDLGLAYCGTKGSDYFCFAPVIVVRADGDSVESTIAHELAHTYLLGETYWNPFGEGRGEEARSSINMPGPECLFLEDGCPVEDFHIDLPRRQMSVNLPQSDANYRTFVKRDLMGKTGRDQRWMDFFTWDYFYGIFNEGRPIGGSSLRVLATGNWISVAGTVGVSGGGSLSTFWHGTGDFTETDVPSGDWSIEIQSGGRAPLAVKTFHVDFLPIHQRTQPLSEAPFSITLPLPGNAEWVVLKKDGVELDSRRIVSSPPTVRVIVPNGGENLSGITTIRWEGSDSDDDPLSYAVMYEPQQGRRIPLAIGLSAPSLEWDTSLAPASSSGRIIVVANDGFNDASDQSDGTFRVSSGGPVVSIFEPNDLEAVEAGTSVTLRGGAWDPEDGAVSSASLTFRSNRDGLLGNGTSVTTLLSEGVHTITLTATDRDGNSATDSISVTVFTPVSIRRILPAVGSLAGDLGSFFKTGIQLHNPTASTIAGRFSYHPANQSADPGDPLLAFSLAPGQTIYYPDLLPEMFQSGLGSADLVTTLGTPPQSVVRIFNDAGGSGTTGMTEPQIDPATVLVAGDETVLILPPDPARARFNIGIRTLDEGGSFYPTLLDKNGILKIGLGKKSYPPNYFTQFSAASLFADFGVELAGTDALRITVGEGSLIIYGATTDNTTQDPSLQFATAQAPIGPTGERKIIPVVGSLEGDRGSYFKTELQFHNAQKRAVRVRIDYRERGSSAIRGTLEFEIRNYKSHYIPDLLPAMGIAAGIGTAEITATSVEGGLPASVIRIFNDAGTDGASGMTEEAVRPDDALQPGERGVLIAPPDPVAARFNIGIRALDQGCSMAITIRDSQGQVRTTLAKSFGANAFDQLDATAFLGITPGANDSITFTINSGSAIIYGATNDNATQDPSLQFAKSVF